jgi:hypothetical protein
LTKKSFIISVGGGYQDGNDAINQRWRLFVGKHYDLARQMGDDWCRFIKSGNPDRTGSDETPLCFRPVFRTEEAAGLILRGCGKNAAVSGARNRPAASAGVPAHAGMKARRVRGLSPQNTDWGKKLQSPVTERLTVWYDGYNSRPRKHV